jgi:alanyl-tRNA synthetase
MTSDQIRQTFLDFFAARDHRVVVSSSLVPAGDPTLLFTNAGMNQFKDVFLGREKRDYARAVTCQKCVRAGGKHNDLEQVGRTARHHTFFEMLGNFSFGDYFKDEAIPWAWELITEGYQLPAEKLYVTIFREDDEAGSIWHTKVGLARNRIFRMGEKDNFWAMGETGPCGPCSEIHYDMGPGASEQGHADCQFPCDCGRYVELWNLVFMQFDRDEQGNLTRLPRPSIDTGAGLERLAAALQGKLSNFDTDLFRPLIDEAASLAKVKYGANHEADVSLRIIADHARASTFLISDGVLPSNEGRGYVLRLIMRRALYHGQTLGLNEPFLYKMSGQVVEMMKGAYPELADAAQHVAKAIKIEEERYGHTTRRGLEALESCRVITPSGALLRFEHARKYLPTAGEEARKIFFSPVPPGYTMRAGEWFRFQLTERGFHLGEAGMKLLTAGSPPPYGPGPAGHPTDRIPVEGIAWIAGNDLFMLHDTFGLRPDFARDVVKSVDPNLEVDWAGYETEMQKQRERARASWKGAEKKAAQPAYQQLAEEYQTDFYGYSETETRDCRILALVVDGVSKSSVGPGTKVEIVLDRTPFYAEAGGQIGDTGYLTEPGSPRRVAEIEDTYRPVTGIIAHKAVARETIAVGDLVTARVDAERRDAIRRNHTATHLLHASLRKVLGTHVKQAGSLVAPDRLRFDFSHYASVDRQDLKDIEDLVNEHTLSDEEIRTEEMSLDQALALGAMALFGEKYSDRVRVVSVADGTFSRELCGGTHVGRTGEIGLFKLTSEGSVSAGTRRVEALTGTGLLDEVRRKLEILTELETRLRAKPDNLLDSIEKLEESEKKLRKELEARGMRQAAAQASDLLGAARDVKGVRLISARVEAPGADPRAAMRQIVDDLRPRLGSGVIVLGSVTDGKVSLVAAVSKDLTDRLDAGKIIRAVAPIVEGGGGGRRDLAEAGGRKPEKLPELIEAVPSILAGML